MYQTINESFVLRLGDNSVVPCDTANSDYQRYLVWLAEGNTPEPVPEPAAPSAEAQISALLAASGETRLTVQMAIEVCESNAITMGAALGMTAEASIAYAYNKNKAYRTCKDLEAAILALEQP